jgi:DNA-binding response OmpR family regulator
VIKLADGARSALERASAGRVLVVDDEEAIRDLLDYGLPLTGLESRSAVDGPHALTVLKEWNADVIVLDVMLPVIDGYALLPMLRRVTDAPILMLSAVTSASEKVRCLETGADDYVEKPFIMEELVARIKSAMRRPRLEVREFLSYADLSMTVGTRVVKRSDTLIDLSQREYELLKTFLRNPERTLPRRELLQAVWGTEKFITTTIVDTYVSYLRAKIDAGFKRKLIRTVRGAGYALEEHTA